MCTHARVVCDQHVTRTARAPVRTATAPSAVTSVDLTLWQSLAELTEHALVWPIILLTVNRSLERTLDRRWLGGVVVRTLDL